jgi:hypothetical protein
MASIKSTVNRLEADVNLQHQIIHGDENTTVITESGSQPSIRKALVDTLEQVRSEVTADAAANAGSSVESILQRLANIESQLGASITPTPLLSILSKTDTSISGVLSAIAGATYKIWLNNVLTLTTASATFTLTGLTEQTTYTIKATATVNGVESAVSGSVAITTDITPIVVDAPIVALVSNSVDYDSAQVTVAGVTGAAVTLRVNGAQYATGTVGDTFTITGLTQSAAYQIDASQTVDGVASAFSSAVTVNTSAVPVPTFVTSDITDTTIVGTFGNLEAGATVNGTINGTPFSTTNAAYTFNSLNAETAYTIQFTQTVSGQTSASASVTVTTDAAATDPVPANAVYFNSEAVTYNGEYVTYG